LNPKGTRLTYSTYIGSVNSNAQQSGYGIAVDSAGSAYVTGTANGNLVTTPGAFQTVNTGNNDAFVVKITPEGSRMVFSTFLGGSGYDEARGIALDGAGNIFVAGRTQLTNFPTTPGVFQSHNSDGSLFRSTDAGNTWSPLSKGLNVVSVNLLQSGSSPGSTLYAFQNGDARLFRSSDQGVNWNATTPALATESLQSLQSILAVDPVTPSTLYVGVSDPFAPARGLIKTTDGGNTWRSIQTGLNAASFVLSLDIDPSNPSVIYAGTGMGVFKSTDGGGSWTGTGLPIGFIQSLAIDPKMPSTLYAVAGGVIKTTDGGNSWKATGNINNTVQRIVIDPMTPSTVYAIVQGGVFKSIDGGAKWRALPRIISGPDFYAVNSLAIDPFTSTTIYLATSTGVFKSADGGESWTATGFSVNPPNPRSAAFYANAVTVDRANPANIYVGTVANADGFVAKLNTFGSQLLYSTYLGGIGEDVITSLAVDAAGSAYVAGYTTSVSFPTTVDGVMIPPGIDNSRDAIFARLNVTGSGLTYSTYLGSQNFDTANAIAVDALGRIYVAGTTNSAEFRTTSGSFQSAKPGMQSGYIVKFSVLRVIGASISGRKLIVNGEGFDNDAVVRVNGVEQKSKNDGANSMSVLIAKKAGKNIAPGQEVVIQVRNADGTLSNELTFARPLE
ncbi:MAG: SBBP repeat-containing protein, partial [Blastocatellia bacterium]